jgi:hypothetical protein
MRSLPHILLATCLATALMLAAACGGNSGNGGSNDSTSDQPTGEELAETSELLVADPSQALGKSVDHFEQNVESVSAEYFIEMEMGGFTFGADGTFAYRAPDSMYMVMDMNGGGEGVDLGALGEFELLVHGDDLFVNLGTTDWLKMSLSDFGEDSESLKKLMEGHTPLDYEQLVNDLQGDVQNLGDVTVDGTTYTKMRITTDFDRVMASLANSVGDSGLDTGALPMDISGPLTLDILIDKATLLPYTFDASGQFGTGEQSMTFTMNFKFFGYNGPANIPPAPADAKSFEEGFSEAFGDLNAGE